MENAMMQVNVIFVFLLVGASALDSLSTEDVDEFPHVSPSRSQLAKDYLQKRKFLSKKCYTHLGCVTSQCCVRRVRMAEMEESVTFDKAGQCAPASALQDDTAFEINVLTGALRTVQDPLAFLQAEALGQDLLVMCTYRALEDTRKRFVRQTDDDAQLEPKKLVAAVLPPDVAFLRRVSAEVTTGRQGPSSTAQKATPPVTTVHVTSTSPTSESPETSDVTEQSRVTENLAELFGTKDLRRQEPDLANLRVRAEQAQNQLQLILSELKHISP